MHIISCLCSMEYEHHHIIIYTLIHSYTNQFRVPYALSLSTKKAQWAACNIPVAAYMGITSADLND